MRKREKRNAFKQEHARGIGGLVGRATVRVALRRASGFDHSRLPRGLAVNFGPKRSGWFMNTGIRLAGLVVILMIFQRSADAPCLQEHLLQTPAPFVSRGHTLLAQVSLGSVTMGLKLP
jgi:hypothetical protein